VRIEIEQENLSHLKTTKYFTSARVADDNKEKIKYKRKSDFLFLFSNDDHYF